MTIEIGFVHQLKLNSASVRSFYADNWKRKIALSETKFYEWQFTHNPESEGKDHCVVAVDHDSRKILGVMGLTRRTFFLNGKPRNGAELTTWVVSSESVGMGIGSKILKFIQENFDVLIGMGISEAALPIYMKSGFRFMRSIPRFVKVLRFDNIKHHAVHNELGFRLIELWSAKDDNEWSAQEVSTKNYETWLSKEDHDMHMFTRDNNHRLWRYDQHPVFEYRQFLVEDSKLPGNSKAFVSLREELSIPEFKVLHVLDLLGSGESIRAAIGFIESYAKHNSFDLVDFYCTSSRINRFFLARGWFSTLDDLCFQFPHLFNPIELRLPPTTSLIYWSSSGLEDMADMSNLYVTKQDADLDRPTLWTLVEKHYL